MDNKIKKPRTDLIYKKKLPTEPVDEIVCKCENITLNKKLLENERNVKGHNKQNKIIGLEPEKYKYNDVITILTPKNNVVKRNELVKKIMTEKGYKMIDASKYVKDNDLYKKIKV